MKKDVMIMRCSLAIAGILFGGVVVVADVLYLRTGGELEGVIIREEDHLVELEINGGSMVIRRDDIIRIERREREEQEEIGQALGIDVPGAHVPDCLAFVANFTSGDRARYDEALREVSAIRDPEAVPALVAFIDRRDIWRDGRPIAEQANEDPQVRYSDLSRVMRECESAITALERMSYVPGNAALFEDYTDLFLEVLRGWSHFRLTVPARNMLANTGRPALPALLEVLSEEGVHESTRKEAAEAVRHIGSKYEQVGDADGRYGIPAEHIPGIVRLMELERGIPVYESLMGSLLYGLDDADLSVAVPVVLGTVERMDAVEEERVRRRLMSGMIRVLSKVENGEALSAAIPFAIAAAEGEYGTSAQREAIPFLGRMGDHGIPALVECWERDLGAAGEETGSERAAFQLLEAGPPGVTALIELMTDLPHERQEDVVAVLRYIRNKEKIPTLIDALETDNEPVRNKICSVLRDLTGRRHRADADVWREWWEEDKDIVEIRWVR